MSLIDKIDINRVPNHVAIIMDGNGRWAKQRGLDRVEGHRKGVDSVRDVVEAAVAANIKWLTLYAFSTENWQRPNEEVVALMSLMVKAIANETESLKKNGVKLKFIGDIDRLPQETQDSVYASTEETANGNKLTLAVAISYSSRWEIANVAKTICSDINNGVINEDDINEDIVGMYINNFSVPDVDLLIRSGGDIRISNFLLWQAAYAELYFTQIFWPDFDGDELLKAIIEFQKKERRFGKTSEQLEL